MITGGQRVEFVSLGKVIHGVVVNIGERTERGSSLWIRFNDRMHTHRWEDELSFPKWTGKCPLHLAYMKREHPAAMAAARERLHKEEP